MNKIKEISIKLAKTITKPYYHGFAEQLAFFFLLSIVPVFILLSQILALFSISLEYLTGAIEKYVAEEVASIVVKMFEHHHTGAMNFVFLFIALWAASKAEFAIMRIANFTMTGGESTGENYFKERFRAVRTIVITLFTFTFSLIILVYGEIIINFVAMFINRKTGVDFHVHSFWLFIRWPVTMCLYFFMVSYNYFVLPSQKVKFKSIIPGSIFASMGMLAVTIGYKYYMEHMAKYDVLYGSMAAIVALMMWFYFLAWVLVLGIIINKILIDMREQN